MRDNHPHLKDLSHKAICDTLGSYDSKTDLNMNQFSNLPMKLSNQAIPSNKSI